MSLGERKTAFSSSDWCTSVLWVCKPILFGASRHLPALHIAIIISPGVATLFGILSSRIVYCFVVIVLLFTLFGILKSRIVYFIIIIFGGPFVCWKTSTQTPHSTNWKYSWWCVCDFFADCNDYQGKITAAYGFHGTTPHNQIFVSCEQKGVNCIVFFWTCTKKLTTWMPWFVHPCCKFHKLTACRLW